MPLLKEVLQRRTHVKKNLGKTYLLRGTLVAALKLPQIQDQLQSKSRPRRERGLEAFQSVWNTLSPETRQLVLDQMGWYEPEKLSWDDPRSNRRPTLTELSTEPGEKKSKSD
ncbi:MAG: hypothetical protein H6999_02920 [Hahellaceae bacterium]|nr:hypothetical protein [Hahellaceae bacterium]MCP5168696.1 hypothetical protein [Hahellaceae bacterium]